MCLALRATRLWLCYTTLQNVIPSYAWIVNQILKSIFAIWQPCREEVVTKGQDVTLTVPLVKGALQRPQVQWFFQGQAIKESEKVITPTFINIRVAIQLEAESSRISYPT